MNLTNYGQLLKSSDFLMGAKSYVCIGKIRVQEDAGNLENGVHVIVGIPGRVNDMIERGNLKTNKIKMFVLDEADEMLSRGFKEQIHSVIQYIEHDTQIVLLSTTMSPMF